MTSWFESDIIDLVADSCENYFAIFTLWFPYYLVHSLGKRALSSMLIKDMKTLYQNIKNRIISFRLKTGQPGKHQILFIILYSIQITLALEILNRHSVLKGLDFILKNPIMFLLNNLIILLTLSVAMIFSRRRFCFLIVSIFWLGLGIADNIILYFRLTPLSVMDFYTLPSNIKLLPLYLNTYQILLIVILLGFLIGLIVFLWKKLKKSRYQFKIPLTLTGISTVLFLLLFGAASKMNILLNRFDNLHDAYDRYGFVYCFSNSVFERGIKKPVNYSEEKMNEILKRIQENSCKLYSKAGMTAGSVSNPNIIMVQLESFFDVNLLKKYQFSENPVPNYQRLKQEYSGGFLTVPVCGAGTVNTEFEVITGMNTQFFGVGEYPYRTILKSTTSESICYDLEKFGYHNNVIHNNTAVFYDRNHVFPNLGFDNFCSLEYMNHVEYNKIGWAKDSVLTQEILKALKASNSKDFIYTISVQPHGKYPDTVIDNKQRIKIIAEPDNSSSDKKENDEKIGFHNRLEYYVNQLSETDQFIGDLTAALSDYREPTVVVFFGDHLPPLSLEEEKLVSNKNQTEYVLWSNFSMEKVKKDLPAYQLSAYIMARLGIDGGILTRFHQRCLDDSEYQQALKLLQYDMLYGKRYIYKGQNPFIKKEMKMGIFEPEISDIKIKGGDIYVYGKNFTPCSMVYVSKEPRKTLLINQSTLKIPFEELSDKTVYVAQTADHKIVLSRSKEWTKE